MERRTRSSAASASSTFAWRMVTAASFMQPPNRASNRAPGRASPPSCRPLRPYDASSGSTRGRPLGILAAMYSQTTDEIEIAVNPNSWRTHRKSRDRPSFWAYTIRIQNHGARTVQLMHRHWRITDANGRLEEVKGPGVVGEQPILAPGESFSYTSVSAADPFGNHGRLVPLRGRQGRGVRRGHPRLLADSPQARRVIN